MFRLLRQILNLMVAGALMYIIYHGSIAVVDNLLTRVHDDFVVSLIKSYPVVVGCLGILFSLGIIGIIVLLHDVGHWVTSWFFVRRA